MPILKWLLHQNVDLEVLKREIKELYDLFKEYIIFFEEKAVATSEFRYKFKLPGLKSEIVRFNRAILQQLEVEENEKRLIRIIITSNVLTGKEESIAEVIRKKLRLLKAVLRKQLALYEELTRQIEQYEDIFERDTYSLDPNTPLVRSMRTNISNLNELLKMEYKLLFGERSVVYQLKEFVVDDFEFPVVRNVECPCFKTAILAQRNLSLFNKSRLEVAYLAYIPEQIACNGYKLVFYPGSLDDPIAIFCFPNAEIYILQDPQEVLKHLYEYLKVLNRTNVIHNLRKRGNEFIFTFNEQRKLLKAYYGNKGYSERYVPPEIKQFGVDVVMTKAFSITNEEREAILENVSPYIKRRGFVVCASWIIKAWRKRRLSKSSQRLVSKIIRQCACYKYLVFLCCFEFCHLNIEFIYNLKRLLFWA